MAKRPAPKVLAADQKAMFKQSTAHGDAGDRSEARRTATGLQVLEFNAGVDLQVAVRDRLSKPVTMLQALRLMAVWVRENGLTTAQSAAFAKALAADDEAARARKTVLREEELASIRRGPRERSTPPR